MGLFDSIKINKQLESITWMREKDLFHRGDFVWKDGKRDGMVEFKQSQKGKFYIHKAIPVNLEWNDVDKKGTKFTPTNVSKFVAGCDPFDHNVVASGSRMSNGAGYVYAKYDANSDLSETFICEYIHRPQTSDIFYEDMLKMSVFFGCKILVENNKIGIVKYFQFRGYEKFLMKLPKSKTFGVPANAKTHQQMVEELELYVFENCNKVIFKNLLIDLLSFDINNTTKFDAAMAAGWTLVACGKKNYQQREFSQKKLYDVREIFPI